VELKVNATHLLLSNDDDVNQLFVLDDIDTIKKKTQTIIDASKDVGLSSRKCRANS
jgi:hypothetical protein